MVLFPNLKEECRLKPWLLARKPPWLPTCQHNTCTNPMRLFDRPAIRLFQAHRHVESLPYHPLHRHTSCPRAPSPNVQTRRPFVNGYCVQPAKHHQRQAQPRRLGQLGRCLKPVQSFPAARVRSSRSLFDLPLRDRDVILKPSPPRNSARGHGALGVMATRVCRGRNQPHEPASLLSSLL